MRTLFVTRKWELRESPVSVPESKKGYRGDRSIPKSTGSKEETPGLHGDFGG